MSRGLTEAKSGGPACVAEIGGGARATRRAALVLLAVVAAAGAWRAALAWRSPALSRDGVGYCWFARDLGRDGLDVLRRGDYDQHPLYSTCILLVQRVLRAAGADDSPATWDRAGRATAWTFGLTLIVACAALATRLARAVPGAVDATTLGLWAAAIAALLPLNNLLAADAMSEPLFLTLYVLATATLVRLHGLRAAVGCGLLGGLAFLTRPEGAMVCVAGAALLGWRFVRLRSRRAAFDLAALVAAFALVTTPYCLVIGSLTPKLYKETKERFLAPAGGTARLAPAREPLDGVRSAALVREDVGLWLAGPRAAYETLRGGRVVVPLLALGAVAFAGRRLLVEPLLGPGLCAAGHFALTALLVHRHGYLDPRHALVVVTLLIPAAAASLAWMTRAARGPARAIGWVAALACLVPLGVYAARVPNPRTEHLVRAAEALRALGPQVAGTRLMGGMSQVRIAFYADLRFVKWPEDEPVFDRRWQALRAHLLRESPDWFTIETGGGDEEEHNERLLGMLRRDEAIGPRLTLVFEAPRVERRGRQAGRLYVFSLAPAAR